jgi:hypothetical protein
MKKKVKTKKMTIDKLAIIVAKGFEGIQARMATKEDLQNLEKRMDAKMDTRVEGINKRIDHLAETKVSKVAYKELENRVGFIEKKIEIKK